MPAALQSRGSCGIVCQIDPRRKSGDIDNGTRVLANPIGYRTSNWREPRTANSPLRVVTENERFNPALVVEI